MTVTQERLESLPKEALGRIRWQLQARPEQLPPDTDWWLWVIVAGRGFGKTRTAAEWMAHEMVTRPMTRWAIIAPTFADCRDTCVEGESGLLAVLDNSVRSYNRTTTEVILNNGSRARSYAAVVPDRLRGPQFHGAWLDEPASFRYGMQVWQTLQPALRLGDTPKVVATGTPAPVPLMREFFNRIDGERAVMTRGRTLDNADNLPDILLDELQRRYGGTRLGRQELEGELLEDVEGALWSYELATRNRREDAPEDLQRIVVAIDPAMTSKDSSNETGIIVAGVDSEQRGYVLEDLTLTASPLDWANQAIDAYNRWNADAIVAETNAGGDMVIQTIRTVDPNVRVLGVHASRGKATRAEPVVALYEQNRVIHCGKFPALEEQMASWVPGVMDSPDRVDAMVWAFTNLILDRRAPAPVPTFGTGSITQKNPWELS